MKLARADSGLVRGLSFIALMFLVGTLQVRASERRARDVAFIDGAGDSALERVVVFASASGGDGGILLEEFRGGAWREVASVARPGFDPFKVLVGDLDNDGEPEALVGLFDRAMRGRPGVSMKFHLYDLRDRKLSPRWFCEREVADFAVARVRGRDRLVTIELRGRESRARLYRWDSFGFWAEGLPVILDRRMRFGGEGERLRIEDESGRVLFFADDEAAWNLDRGGE